MAYHRDRIEPPPAVALTLEHLEQRAAQDAADARTLELATKAAEGEYRPEGQARAVALELATRAALCDPSLNEGQWIMDEDDWCLALAACLVSLGVEVRIVAVRGRTEQAWSCAVEYRDGVEWSRALSLGEASQVVSDSMEPE
jgi:hypothetical protein